MGPAVQSTLLQPRTRHGERQFGEFDEARAEGLATLGSFEGLATAVLLAAWAERIASPRLRELALSSYLQMQPALVKLPETAPFAAELFWAIDGLCKHWVFASTQSRLEIVIFSYELAGRPPGERAIVEAVTASTHHRRDLIGPRCMLAHLIGFADAADVRRDRSSRCALRLRQPSVPPSRRGPTGRAARRVMGPARRPLGAVHLAGQRAVDARRPGPGCHAGPASGWAAARCAAS